MNTVPSCFQLLAELSNLNTNSAFASVPLVKYETESSGLTGNSGFGPTDASIPNFNDAKHFLEVVHSNSSQACIQIFAEGLHTGAPEIVHIPLPLSVSDFTTLANTNNGGFGIFTSVNTTDGTGRKKDNITNINAFVCDLDGSSIEPVKNFPLKPHLILESSPGKYHAWYLVIPVEADAQTFKTIQHSIADRFNGDQAVCDLPRVLRCSGFFHRKGIPFLTHIIVDNSHLPRYDIEEVKEAFQTKKIETIISQSENKTYEWVVKELQLHEMILQTRDNMYDITCPWESVHTPDGIEERTSIGLLTSPWFKCHHKNCKDKHWKQLIEYMNISSGAEVILQPLDEVVPKPITWFWKNRVAEGKVTIISGEPGVSKSLLTLYMAAAASRGSPWPIPGEGNAPLGSTILITCEDDAADTLVPRLKAAGADLSRIKHLKRVKNDDDDETSHMWSISDAALLSKKLGQMPECRLVIIDPISAYMNGADTHNNAEVRETMTAIQDLAEQHNVAVVIISHFNKNDKVSALNRTSGSGAFVALSRAAYAVIRDPENPARRIIGTQKNNLAEDSSGLTGLAYTIKPVTTPYGVYPVIEWEHEKIVIDLDSVMNKPKNTQHKSKQEDAVSWLFKILSSGMSHGSYELESMANKVGISHATLYRARAELCVETKRIFNGEGKLKKAVWQLPRIGRNGKEHLSPLKELIEHQKRVTAEDLIKLTGVN